METADAGRKAGGPSRGGGEITEWAWPRRHSTGPSVTAMFLVPASAGFLLTFRASQESRWGYGWGGVPLPLCSG